MSDDPKLECTQLGGRMMQDGISFQMHIYRIVGSFEGWELEVVDPTDASTT